MVHIKRLIAGDYEKTFRDRGSGFVIGFYRMTRSKLEDRGL